MIKRFVGMGVCAAMLLALASCNTGGPTDAATMDALAAEPLKSQPWKFGDVPGVIIYSAHYRVYTTIRDALYQHLLLKVLEAAYARAQMLNAGTQVTPPGGFFDCFVFGDRPQWELYTKLKTGVNSPVYLQISAGGYCQEGVFAGYDIGQGATLSVIAHESWHQYSWFAFKDRLPSWLEEGIATQNEQIEWDGTTPSFDSTQNYRRWTALQAAVREHRLWALRDLTATHAGKVVNLAQKYIDSYYAQLWAMVLFLEQSEEYRPKLIALLKGAREGKLSATLTGSAATPYDILHFTEQWNAVAGPRYLASFIDPDTFAFEKKYDDFITELANGGWPPKKR